MKPTRASSCIHEAGHAIVAEKLGWAEVLGLRVNSDCTGACYFGDQEDGEAGLRHDLTVSIAGRIAQALASSRDPAGLSLPKVLRLEGGAKGQRCTYADFVYRRAQLTGDADSAAASRWVDDELVVAAELAAHILRRHWGEVLALASALDRAAIHDGVSVVFTEAGEAALEVA